MDSSNEEGWDPDDAAISEPDDGEIPELVDGWERDDELQFSQRTHDRFADQSQPKINLDDRPRGEPCAS